MSSPAAELRTEHQRIAQRLEAAASGAEREAVRRDIIAHHRRLEALLDELARLKKDAHQLMERYRQLAEVVVADPAPAPQFRLARPPTTADHLGASTFIDRGWSLIALGDHIGAIEALERALSLAPGDVQAESLLGWAQMLGGRYDEALQTFQRVLVKEPQNALARVNVGYICMKKRIFGEAIEHLTRAIRLDNDRKATLYGHFYLGLVYLERDMLQDAESFLRQALKLGPNLIEAYHELGRAQWLAGNREAAAATWAAGARAGRLSPWGRRCQDLLEHVRAGGEVSRS